MQSLGHSRILGGSSLGEYGQCRNGDRYGLKGQRSLERFNILMADQKYRVMSENDALEMDLDDDWD
jgi:hypothetical protein